MSTPCPQRRINAAQSRNVLDSQFSFYLDGCEGSVKRRRVCDCAQWQRIFLRRRIIGVGRKLMDSTGERRGDRVASWPSATDSQTSGVGEG